jgi:hypothetical protein
MVKYLNTDALVTPLSEISKITDQEFASTNRGNSTTSMMILD